MNLRALSPIFLLLSAVCVTSSSVYVTVKAAAQQESESPVQEEELLPPAPLDSGIAGTVASEQPVAGDVPVVAVSSTVDPQDVLHDRSHTVKLDANGGFSGQLSALSRPDGNLIPSSDVTVRIVRDGAVVSRSVTNEEGIFTFTGLSEGVVAVIATGPDALLLYSVYLSVGGEEVANATPVKFEANEASELSVNAAVVSGADLPLAKELVIAGLSSGEHRFSGAVNASDQNYALGAGEYATSVAGHQVQLQADGSLVGEINLLDSRTGRHREVIDLTLHFIRNGELVASTPIEANGQFTVAGLHPSVYSIVVNGTDGVLAMGVDVVGAFAHLDPKSPYRFASLAQSLDLAVAPVNSQNLNAQNASQITDGQLAPGAAPGIGAPLAGGMSPVGGGAGGFAGAPGSGFTGGSGGGGGGVGGGGGLGALLGAAAAGAIGYALGDDNSASPSR